MSKGGSAPKAPDPNATAAAQTGTNVTTSLANAVLQSVNRNTPDGSLNYSFDYNSGTTLTDQQGREYKIPQITATETLTPQGERIRGKTNDMREGMANIGADATQRLGGILNSSMDLSSVPKIGAAPGSDGSHLTAEMFMDDVKRPGILDKTNPYGKFTGGATGGQMDMRKLSKEEFRANKDARGAMSQDMTPEMKKMQRQIYKDYKSGTKNAMGFDDWAASASNPNRAAVAQGQGGRGAAKNYKEYLSRFEEGQSAREGRFRPTAENPYAKRNTRAAPAQTFDDWRSGQDFADEQEAVTLAKAQVQRYADGAAPDSAVKALEDAKAARDKAMQKGYKQYTKSLKPEFDKSKAQEWREQNRQKAERWQERYDAKSAKFDKRQSKAMSQAEAELEAARAAAEEDAAQYDVNTNKLRATTKGRSDLEAVTDERGRVNLRNTTLRGENELNTDFSQDRRRVERALMQRLNNQLAKDREAQEAQLLNQGIGLGSRAYSASQDDMARASTDARLGAILSAGQEQSRMAADARAQGQYNLGVQQQTFGQRMARDQAQLGREQQAFGQNAAVSQDARAQQQQAFNQRLAGRGDQRAAIGQQYNQDQNTYQNNLAARQQALQEQFALRNQPINEISSLLSGSQVASPNFQVNTPGAIPTVDQAALIQQGYQNEFGAWQQNQQQRQQLMGGLLGMGAGLLGF